MALAGLTRILATIRATKPLDNGGVDGVMIALGLGDEMAANPSRDKKQDDGSGGEDDTAKP